MTWTIERVEASASVLHERELSTPTVRAVSLLRASSTALVLGSTQPMALIDEASCRAFGIEVARRRSGGGAVLLEGDACAWIDVVIPRDDELWLDDVGAATYWLGDAWVRALVRAGCDESQVSVHRGRLQRHPWSDRVCFAGLGPGEITVSQRKLVGIAQRRTRVGARFQMALLNRWEPEHLAPLFTAPGPTVSDLAPVAIGLTELGCDANAVVDALLDELRGL